MSTALGNHILVEFMNCDPHIMNDVSAIERDMVAAAQKAGATVINSTFHHFSPYGVSGVVVIQESHLAIHTWPEYGYAAVGRVETGPDALVGKSVTGSGGKLNALKIINHIFPSFCVSAKGKEAARFWC